MTDLNVRPQGHQRTSKHASRHPRQMTSRGQLFCQSRVRARSRGSSFLPIKPRGPMTWRPPPQNDNFNYPRHLLPLPPRPNIAQSSAQITSTDVLWETTCHLPFPLPTLNPACPSDLQIFVSIARLMGAPSVGGSDQFTLGDTFDLASRVINDALRVIPHRATNQAAERRENARRKPEPPGGLRQFYLLCGQKLISAITPLAAEAELRRCPHSDHSGQAETRCPLLTPSLILLHQHALHDHTNPPHI